MCGWGSAKTPLDFITVNQKQKQHKPNSERRSFPTYYVLLYYIHLAPIYFFVSSLLELDWITPNFLDPKLQLVVTCQCAKFLPDRSKFPRVWKCLCPYFFWPRTSVRLTLVTMHNFKPMGQKWSHSPKNDAVAEKHDTENDLWDVSLNISPICWVRNHSLHPQNTEKKSPFPDAPRGGCSIFIQSKHSCIQPANSES